VLDRQAGNYSGGLKRRLNLALGLVNQPEILYLDEPTVGVDAQSRQFILEAIAALRREGTTIVYTSHYMEEVENLCDRLTVIDHGRTLASGPIQELLARLGGTSMEVTFQEPPTESLSDELVRWSPVAVDERTLRLDARDTAEVKTIMGLLEERGIEVEGVRYGVERLEDVYLRLLGWREPA